MKRTPLYLLLPVMALAGCELLVDFDRTMIPAESADGSVIVPGTDGSVENPDGSVDIDAATDEDAAASDAGDGGADANATDDGGETDGGETDAGGSDDGGAEDDDGGDAG